STGCTLASASLKQSSPPSTAALPKRGESNITLQGRKFSRSNAPFQIMFLPAGVEAPAGLVAFGLLARAAAGARTRRAAVRASGAAWKNVFKRRSPGLG